MRGHSLKLNCATCKIMQVSHGHKPTNLDHTFHNVLKCAAFKAITSIATNINPNKLTRLVSCTIIHCKWYNLSHMELDSLHLDRLPFDDFREIER